MTQFHSNFNETTPFSDMSAQVNLDTNASQSYSVAGDRSQKYKVTFSYNAVSNIFVGLNVSFALPPTNVTNTDANVEFRPDERYVIGGDVLSFLTPDTDGAYMSLRLLKIPG